MPDPRWCKGWRLFPSEAEPERLRLLRGFVNDPMALVVVPPLVVDEVRAKHAAIASTCERRRPVRPQGVGDPSEQLPRVRTACRHGRRRGDLLPRLDPERDPEPQGLRSSDAAQAPSTSLLARNRPASWSICEALPISTRWSDRVSEISGDRAVPRMPPARPEQR